MTKPIFRPKPSSIRTAPERRRGTSSRTGQPALPSNSAYFLAEIPLRSPRILFVFIIKKIYFQDQSIQQNKLFNFEKRNTAQQQ